MVKRPFIILAVLLLFLFSLFLGIDRFMHSKSQHFSFSQIAAFQENLQYSLPALDAEEQKKLDKILSQNFIFFAKGSHAYLFLSEDHKYILKLLKQDTLRPKSWLAYIPASFNPYYHEHRQKLRKQKKMFSAYKTAYTELKEETGLIYMHINPTRTLNRKITLCDKHDKQHTIDLDKTSFYLQKKARLIYPRISELMRLGDIEHAKNIISSVFQLIEYLGKKGVIDNTPTLYKNFGLINDKAVHIDIRKLKINRSHIHDECYKQQVATLTESFRRWIEKHYPELLDHFDAKLEEVIRPS